MKKSKIERALEGLWRLEVKIDHNTDLVRCELCSNQTPETFKFFVPASVMDGSRISPKLSDVARARLKHDFNVTIKHFSVCHLA